MSEHNITVTGGTSIRLPTAGKYCDRDIVITAEGGGGGGDDMAGALADRTITEFSSSKATKIGDYAFRTCTKLTTVNAPNATSVGEYSFQGCSVLASVNLPMVESLGTYAFNQCTKLKSIVLPSLTSSLTNAFRDTQYIETIDLGANFASIPANMFYGCRGLKALILRSQTMVTLANTSAFTTCYRILGTKNAGFNPNGEILGFIYVPAALIEEYKAATNWSTFEVNFRAIEDYPEITGG